MVKRGIFELERSLVLVQLFPIMAWWLNLKAHILCDPLQAEVGSTCRSCRTQISVHPKEALSGYLVCP